MHWWGNRWAPQLRKVDLRSRALLLWAFLFRTVRIALHEFNCADHNVLRSSADRFLLSLVVLPLDAGEAAVARPVRIAVHSLRPRLRGRRVTVVGHAEDEQGNKK